MPVYVDDMEANFKPKHAPGRRYILCHMVADTEEELHTMADKIGVARKWSQGDHYDIAKTKRRLAVSFGAVELTRRELGLWLLKRRKEHGNEEHGNEEHRKKRREVHEGKARDGEPRPVRKSTKDRRTRR